MTNFIPIFPLQLVVFPGEVFKLHIFEPRYKQLISECSSTGKPFGIPVVLKDIVLEMGTLVEVKEILKTYEDGKMDIEARGLDVFRILEQIPNIPEKLYSGAIVSYPENNRLGKITLMQKILSKIKALHVLLQIEKSFGRPDELLTSYDVAHYIGLSLEEEYELLQLTQELQRLEFLKRYLNKKLVEIRSVIKSNQSGNEPKEFMGFSLN